MYKGDADLPHCYNSSKKLAYKLYTFPGSISCCKLNLCLRNFKTSSEEDQRLERESIMSLTIKAFLHEQSWRGEPKEIRRFSVDQDVSTSYAYLLEKLAQVFPSVQAGSVVIAWMGK